jgi:hypothetical protein
MVPKQFPCDWRPESILDPRYGMYFTGPGAWDFAADLLDDNHPIVQVTLRIPANAKGYEMYYRSGGASIYIKLQLGCGVVLGRSFHSPYYPIAQEVGDA